MAVPIQALIPPVIVIVGGLTTTVNNLVLVHKPLFGVNVYVVVCVLFIAGNQVPAKPLLEVVGKLNVAPKQIAGIDVKVGETAKVVLIVTVLVVAIPQELAFGINV